MPNLFLTFASQDKDQANKLVMDLRNAGISVWYDENKNLVGHDIGDNVYDGIRNSQFLALLITPDFIQSQWAKKELNGAKIQDIENDEVTIATLLFQDCTIPDDLKTKKYIDFRSSYENGLNQLLDLVNKPAFPKEIGENKTEVEDILNKSKKEIDSLAQLMLTPKKLGENKYTAPEHYSDENIEKLKGKITQCINLLDHLISIEKSKPLLLNYYSEARELSSMILDYKRESLYFAYILENSPVIIHNLIMQGIANANAGQKIRGVDSFSKALRLYFEFQELPGDDAEKFETSLIKFVYTVTRHIRIELTYTKPFRDLIIFKDRSKLIDRLEKTMDCLDAALEKESIFDFAKEVSCFNYGKLLATIGLTKRALVYLNKARQLGCPDSEFKEAGIDMTALEQEIESMEKSIREGIDQTLHVNIIQVPNFFLQFGRPPQNFEEMIEKRAPDFYKNIIEDYKVFEKSKP